MGMMDIPTISAAELADRRRRLRRQRRWRALQRCWQIVAVTGLTGGIVWAATLPDWVLRDASQVGIEGNKILTADSVRSLLGIEYPQFLLTVQPTAIAQRLEASQAPIADVHITRQLFPPSLTVHLQERFPVAVVYTLPNMPPSRPGQPAPAVNPVPVSLLDDRGYIMSYDKYVTLNKTRSLPTLKVFGMQEQYRSQWGSLYELISRSPVSVSEVDWREPGNLILYTDLGFVRFGSYRPERLNQQLKVLDQMREIHQQVPLEDIEYIDLTNPENPRIKMVGVVLPTNPDAEQPEEPQ